MKVGCSGKSERHVLIRTLKLEVAWKEVDALATANDFTNGNNPQRAEDAKGIKLVQGIVGSILYYARAVDNKLLCTVSTIGWKAQSSSTRNLDLYEYMRGERRHGRKQLAKHELKGCSGSKRKLKG